MSEPWFNPNYFAWIPGTLLGVLGGTWGGLAGMMAPRGKAKGLVLGLGFGLLAASALLLVVAVVAWAQGQPYGVWYGLGLPGIIGPVVLGANLPNIVRVYRMAEGRKMEARDL